MICIIPQQQQETQTNTVVETKLKSPRMYEVIMLNDDYTPMDFVIHTLQRFFQKPFPVAQEIMMKVHFEGQAVCAVYTFEVAESKAHLVNQYSRDQGHPLTCKVEPCDS